MTREVINWLGVWLFVVAAMLAVVFSVVTARAMLQRRRKREKRMMRDHLNRLSRTWE